MSDATLVKNLINSEIFLCNICKRSTFDSIFLLAGEGTVCKTCCESNKEKCSLAIPNIPLQNVLNYIQVPCKYESEGCQEYFHYQQKNIHEKNCKFSAKPCPVSHGNGKCLWEGKAENLVEHIKEHHTNNVVESASNSFNLESFIDGNVFIWLLIFKNLTFLLRSEVVKNKLIYVLCNTVNGNSQDLEDYTVTHLSDNNSRLNTTAKIQPVDVIFMNTEELCNLIEIDIFALKQILNISLKINLIVEIKTKLFQIDEQLLEHFQCPICSNYMVSPIYQCESGHSVCNTCWPKLKNCPTCRMSLAKIRNFSLEHLTSDLYYPCTYFNFGCLECVKVNELKSHESNCNYKPYDCPIENCSLNASYNTIQDHLKDFHIDKLWYLTEYTKNIKLSHYENSLETLYNLAYGKIFRSIFRNTGPSYFWAVEYIGPASEAQEFSYTVSIFDKRRPLKKLTRTDYCLPQMTNEELFRKCVIVPSNVLSYYSNEGIVTFTVQIEKINK